MSIKFTTLVGIAACALASTAASSQPAPSRGGLIVAQYSQNSMSDDSRDKTMIQKQTDPQKNGTSQSESKDGSNKNGQPQK